MIVFFRRLLAVRHPQAAGHAQMHNERTRVEAEQQIFGAARDIEYLTAGQVARQGRGHRPAQVFIAHDDRAYGLALDMRC